MLKRILLTTIFCLLASPVFATVLHVRQGGSGSMCQDWTTTNVCANIPTGSLVRGDVVLVANGTGYTTNVLSTAESGSVLITIRKATIASHDTSTGWLDSYGDGSAEWASDIVFQSDYWDFDGVTGGGPGCWVPSVTCIFGFTMTRAAADYGGSPRMINVSATGTPGSTRKGVKVRHVSFTQTGNVDLYEHDYNGIYASDSTLGTIVDCIFEYLHFDNLGGLPFFLADGTGAIIQYFWTGHVCGGSAVAGGHCEDIVFIAMNNLQIRWFWMSECPSSGCIAPHANVSGDPIISNSVKIYGGIFGKNGGTYGVAINASTGSAITNYLIANNLFLGAIQSAGGENYTTLKYYNNLVYNAAGDCYGFGRSSSHDYNAWVACLTNQDNMDIVIGSHENGFNASDLFSVPDDVHSAGYAITAGVFPGRFVNAGGTTPEDYKLTAHITELIRDFVSLNGTGIDLCIIDDCVTYPDLMTDMFGHTRGADGVIDRGFAQFVSTTQTGSSRSRARR